MEEYQLPKCWVERVKKYWVKTIPSEYPRSDSEFSVRFASDSITTAVETMEKEIGTEGSVVSGFIPEGNFLTGYFGTYNVSTEADGTTLLSPVSVTTDKIIAIQYTEEANGWSAIQNIEVKNGYVWGTLTNDGPVAVFGYKKEIHFEASIDFMKLGAVVCEGNAVQIKMNDNNKVVVVNPATNKEIELTTKCTVIGGSIDGTPIDTVSISISGVTDATTLNGVYCGSAFYDESTNSATVKSANLFVTNSKVRGLTGGHGAVRIDELNIAVQDSTITNFVAAGESYVSAKNIDVNGSPESTLASRAWVKKANIALSNIDRCYILYASGNNGYMLVQEANLVVDGLKSCDYLTIAGSNGNTVKATAVLNNVTSKQLQFTNRGKVGYSSATVTDSAIDLISIGGDNSEGDVDGTIGTVRIDINSGVTGALKLGVNGTETITADQVEAVKVSRNADVVVDPTVPTTLGEKFIIK